MGYSGIKIPGHSGTQFKHRKSAIFKSKFRFPVKKIHYPKTLKSHKQAPQRSVYLKDSDSENAQYIALVMFIVIGLLIGFIFYKTIEYFHTKSLEIKTIALSKKESEDAQLRGVKIMVNYGNYLLKNNLKYKFT